jgi:hypothetical protein
MEKEVESNFQKLLTSRLLKDDEDIAAFEEAMQFIAERQDPKDIRLLCQAFDDDTEEYEVMFGLVHTLELYDKVVSPNVATNEFIKAIPLMVGKADEWLEVLLFRILNDDSSRTVFTQVLGEAERSTRTSTLKVLKKIAKEDPEEFGEKVNDVVRNM